jgi:hypothetical protein
MNYAVRNTAVKTGVLVVGLGLAVASQAATIDVSAVTAAITDAATACATVGAAGLVLAVGIKVYHWIRRAM